MADTPSAALPETRVEHDSLTAREAAAMRDFHREIDMSGPGVILFQRDAEIISALIDALLADRDRLQRRVEELEAAVQVVTELERYECDLGPDIGAGCYAIMTLDDTGYWLSRADVLGALTSETPHAK